jgi:hypothetical protein
MKYVCAKGYSRSDVKWDVAYSTTLELPPKLRAVYHDVVRSLVQVYYPSWPELDVNALLARGSLLDWEHLFEFRTFTLDVYGALPIQRGAA